MLAYGNTVLKVGTDWLDYLPPVADDTIRFRYIAGTTPAYDNCVLVDASSNIWDRTLAHGSTFLKSLFEEDTNLLEVIAVNVNGITNTTWMFAKCTNLQRVCMFDTSNVNDTHSMFSQCESLQEVPLFNTASVTHMLYMLNECRSLKHIPLFDTSNVIDVDRMCYNCTNVESGALALYNQLSTQQTTVTTHFECFRHCGENTTTGAAELAQIPSDWK